MSEELVADDHRVAIGIVSTIVGLAVSQAALFNHGWLTLTSLTWTVGIFWAAMAVTALAIMAGLERYATPKTNGGGPNDP